MPMHKGKATRKTTTDASKSRPYDDVDACEVM
jgi:hypothetical protein